MSKPRAVPPDFRGLWKYSRPDPCFKIAEGIKAIFWVGVVNYGNEKALLFFTTNPYSGYITGRFVLPKEALLGILKYKRELAEALGIGRKEGSGDTC